jgi:DNA-binding IclR family transcriptional regulator
MNDQASARKDELLKSVLKTLSVLECFSTRDRKLSTSEIARRTGLPRGTAHRVLITLREAGLLEQEQDTYRLGVKLFELGTVVLANMDLHREAQSFVEALTKVTGETVHLCVFNGQQTTLIKLGQPSRDRTTNTVVVMETSPAHCTATGKAALAFQPDSVIARVIGLGLRSYTPQTIVHAPLLLKELEEIRQQGYAVDEEEYSLGTRCVAAPIRNASGRVFASISVSGPIRRMTKAKMASTTRLVIQYAEGISAQLGYRPKQTRAKVARKRPKDEQSAAESSAKGNAEGYTASYSSDASRAKVAKPGSTRPRRLPTSGQARPSRGGVGAA